MPRGKHLHRLRRTISESERVTIARVNCLTLIEKARIEAGLDPGPRPRHPFPRREQSQYEDLSSSGTHKLKHQRVYVHGCEQCYMREFMYYSRHPDLRPLHEWTAGCDNEGLVIKGGKPFDR
jgi:hypothetical protein